MLKIKTLITHLCLQIISDSVAVEIFGIGQLCAKIFRKVRCATFFETRCSLDGLVAAATRGASGSQKRSISADEMYLAICVEWADDHFGLHSI